MADFDDHTIQCAQNEFVLFDLAHIKSASLPFSYRPRALESSLAFVDSILGQRPDLVEQGIVPRSDFEVDSYFLDLYSNHRWFVPLSNSFEWSWLSEEDKNYPWEADPLHQSCWVAPCPNRCDEAACAFARLLIKDNTKANEDLVDSYLKDIPIGGVMPVERFGSVGGLDQLTRLVLLNFSMFESALFSDQPFYDSEALKILLENVRHDFLFRWDWTSQITNATFNRDATYPAISKYKAALSLRTSSEIELVGYVDGTGSGKLQGALNTQTGRELIGWLQNIQGPTRSHSFIWPFLGSNDSYDRFNQGMELRLDLEASSRNNATFNRHKEQVCYITNSSGTGGPTRDSWEVTFEYNLKAIALSVWNVFRDLRSRAAAAVTSQAPSGPIFEYMCDMYRYSHLIVEHFTLSDLYHIMPVFGPMKVGYEDGFFNVESRGTNLRVGVPQPAKIHLLETDENDVMFVSEKNRDQLVDPLRGL